MEPRQTSPENVPRQEAGPDQHSFGNIEVSSPEAVVEAGRNEQTERRLGQSVEIAAQQQGAPAQYTTLPPPVTIPQSDDSVTTPADDNTPMVAADDDLIEKEWVDKAKKVISETKNNPYRREQEVKKLQIDYVKKRYGKSIGASNDGDWDNQIG